MENFLEVIIVLCLFLSYLATLVLKPQKFEIKAVKKEGDSEQETSMTLENDSKKED